MADSSAASGQGTEQANDEVLGVESEINDGSQAQAEDFGEEDPIADDKEMQDAVLNLCKHYAALDKYARRTEIMDARRQRFYWRGDQYIYWNTSDFMFLPWTGAGSGTANSSPAADGPRLTEVYNIFRPYLRAQIAVGVQNAPGVNFEPDDPMKAMDITAARTGENFRHFVDRTNQRKKLQARILYLFGTDGRVILYTRSVRDKQKYGVNDKGGPNVAELINAYGVLESKVPMLTDDICEWPYCFLSDEPDINRAKKLYPKYAENIKQGSSAVGESAYERMARIGVLQGTRLLQQAGDAYAHLATRHRVWLRPEAFRHAPEDMRKELEKLYPEGIKVIWCGDAYCGSVKQSMDDHLAVGWPSPGDGANKPSMMKDMVAVQDAFNDYKNLEKEMFEYGIPVTYRDKEVGDIEAVREQSSEPGNYVDVTRPGGINSLGDCFYREPEVNCPPSLQAAYGNLMGALGQFITGAQPSLFGGSDEHNETKGGIAMLRDQAMGQFAICWGAIQELFASSYKQAVMCAAKARDEKEVLNVKVPARRGKSTIAQVPVANLQKGNFHTYPDTDSSFPETTGAKRQTVQMLVSQALLNPVATEAYGILEPDNLEIQRELLSIDDWVIPGANARDKQMAEIEKLLGQKPTPDLAAIAAHAADTAIEGALAQKAAATGLPTPNPSEPDPSQLYKTTIPVDVKWDFHQFEYETVKDWLSGPDGLEAARTNPWGILNVKLHGLEHQAAMGSGAGPQPPVPVPSRPIGPPALTPGAPGPMNAPPTPMGAPLQ